MTPAAAVGVALIALYLVESIVVAPDDALVLLEGRRDRWRAARLAWSLGGLGLRVTLTNPLRPHGGVLVVAGWRGTQYDAALPNEVAAATDVDEVRRRVALWRRASRWLRVVTLVLALHLFLLWPIAVAIAGARRTWPILVGELVMLLAVTVWQLLRAHRLLAAGAAPSTAAIITMLLSPPAATRAAGLLTRDLVTGLHPLCVVLALCAPDDAARSASETLRDLEFDARGAAIAVWRRVLERRVADSIGLGALSREPHREGGSGGYCPRCWMQYAEAKGQCADCDGIVLRPFTARDAA